MHSSDFWLCFYQVTEKTVGAKAPEFLS